jgi:Lon protease-like protein
VRDDGGVDADPDHRPDEGQRGSARELPMFPLQTVLLPSAVLPLQIFEPRYRVMIRHCIDGDRTFGVALIERGSEVGGGDERSSSGTLAQIVGANELPDGRWYVVVVGTQRLRIERWLPDDPYPRAIVRDWEDDVSAGAASGEQWAALQAQARRVLALAAELGQPSADVTTEFADDPALGTFQVAAGLPLGAFDRQRVLLTEGSGARCQLLAELCGERADDLEALLTMRGGSGGPETA